VDSVGSVWVQLWWLCRKPNPQHQYQQVSCRVEEGQAAATLGSVRKDGSLHPTQRTGPFLGAEHQLFEVACVGAEVAVAECGAGAAVAVSTPPGET
jgi:hypothetical protein